MNAWSHLPNAHHIDWVIMSVKHNPEVWAAAWETSFGAVQVEVWDAAWSAAYDAVRDVFREETWNAARDAVLDADLNSAGNKYYDAAWGGSWPSTAALVAWDDSAQFLEMTSDELEVWARLSNDPRAIMLLPAVRAFERIKELETA